MCVARFFLLIDPLKSDHLTTTRRFNIYIYDYCYKRGFHKTASALMGEADIPADSQPPINANQGLLFELVHSISAASGATKYSP